jgi:hypothetical protein
MIKIRKKYDTKIATKFNYYEKNPQIPEDFLKDI